MTSIAILINRQHCTHAKIVSPKAAGIAFTLSALGQQFDKILNVTLCYPDNQEQSIHGYAVWAIVAGGRQD